MECASCLQALNNCLLNLGSQSVQVHVHVQQQMQPTIQATHLYDATSITTAAAARPQLAQRSAAVCPNGTAPCFAAGPAVASRKVILELEQSAADSSNA
jgi:hypothetical protein